MSSNAENIVITTEEIHTPVVESQALIVEPVFEEKRYEYQPTDEDGRPIGGVQVIKYRTQEELAFKFAEQNTQLLRKLRQETRKNRLGIFDKDTIDESAQKFKQPTEFRRREIGDAERVKLAQDIIDPENFDTAISNVFEARFGLTPETLIQTVNQLQADNLNIKAQRESDLFMAKNPDYIQCPENSEAIVGWITRYELAPVLANFQKAYDTLKTAGVLVTSVEVLPTPIYAPPVSTTEPRTVDTPQGEVTPTREDIPVENQVVVEPIIAPKEEPKPQSRVPSGLNRNNSSDAGVPRSVGDDIVYEFIHKDGEGRQIGDKRVFKGQAAINAMPSDEYKRRLIHEKGFAAKVEKLNQEAIKRQNGR